MDSAFTTDKNRRYRRFCVSTNPLKGFGGFENPPFFIKFGDRFAEFAENTAIAVFFPTVKIHRQSSKDFVDGLNEAQAPFFVMSTVYQFKFL